MAREEAKKAQEEAAKEKQRTKPTHCQRGKAKLPALLPKYEAQQQEEEVEGVKKQIETVVVVESLSEEDAGTRRSRPQRHTKPSRWLENFDL